MIIPEDEAFAAYRLTPRETEVAKLLYIGMLYKEIVAKLHISLPTVRSHVQNLYRKMGIGLKEELIDIVAGWQAERYGETVLLDFVRTCVAQARSRG
jgi:DNA-binding CsgD family transcriptional regulator